MIPTPAPSVAPGSPTPATSIAPAASDDNPYPEAPLNFGPDVPFSRLAKLYDALSNEKKQARKRKLLEKWFNVGRNMKLSYATIHRVDNRLGEETSAMISFLRSG